MSAGSRKLPVYMSDGQSTVSSSADIVGASADDVSRYAKARVATCATCKSWLLQAGQAAIKQQRFVERLVIEEQWKTRHLGAPVETFGLCGQSDGTKISSAFSQACEQYHPRNGRIREDGDW